jgi:hypothetical protein
MAGNIIEQDKVAFRWMLDFDRWRGMDSTGVAVVNRVTSDIGVIKKAGIPDVLFKEPEFSSKGVFNGTGKVFIGHNRAATVGTVNDANAHPFHHGDVVGAHNGTLISTYGLEDHTKFDVDSEAIFYNLSKYTPESVIPDVYGAYALTWYDKNEDKLFIIRNSERPLFWCRRTDGDVIYWASEPWLLDVVLDKCKIKHTVPVSFAIDKLYELDVSDVAPTTFRKVEWVNTTVIKGWEPPPQKKNNHSHVFNNGGNGSNVVPFVGSLLNSTNYSGRTKEEIAVMKSLEGKEIEFRFNGVKKGMSKSEYLSAFPDDPTADWDIRIYGGNNKNWAEWKSKTHTSIFKGKVKKLIQNRFAAKKEVYLLIDLRTIVEVEREKVQVVGNPDVQDMLLEGFNGRFLDHMEWINCTKNGCENCAGGGSVYDQDLVFIDHDKFICGDCIDQFPQHNPQQNTSKEK